MMTGKQKIYFLIDALYDIKVTIPKGQTLIVDPTNDLNRNYDDLALQRLFSKLEQDDKILIIRKAPHRSKEIDIVEDLDPYEHADDGCWHIQLLPAFDKYFEDIQSEPEYIEFTGKGKSSVKVDKPTTSFPKYEKKVLEKIWNILQEIEEKRQMGIEGASVRITSYKGYGSDADQIYEARKTILEKLQSIEAIFNLHKVQTGALFFWAFDLGNKYFDVFEYYKNSYKELAISEGVKKEPLPTEANDSAYTIKYSEKGRQILINNFILASPEFAGENEMVFSYLFLNPNKKIKIDEIEAHLGSTLGKPIHKIIENLGFSGDIKKAFLDVSKQYIRFRNPVTRKDLDELDIKYLKLK